MTQSQDKICEDNRCTHDLGRGVLVSELLSEEDGPWYVKAITNPETSEEWVIYVQHWGALR